MTLFNRSLLDLEYWPGHSNLHDWIPSTLGHGETMCRRCFITNREAAATGELNYCPVPTKEDSVAVSQAQPGGKP